jgi:hypothetical protein
MIQDLVGLGVDLHHTQLLREGAVETTWPPGIATSWSPTIEVAEFDN